MMRYIFLLLALTGMMVGGNGIVLAQEQGRVPNLNQQTEISITPPQYFEPSAQFNGYMHPTSAATILIQEISGTYFRTILPGLTAEYFESEGVQLISQEAVTTASGMKGQLYILRFTIQEVDFERLMLFTGDYQNTAWLIANYPLMAKPELEEVIRNSLLSVQL